MRYYCIAEIEITDRNWVPDYVREVTRLVARYGGRYLSRTSRIEKLEGEREAPQIYLLLEWPSRDAALSFYESEEYRPYRRSRMEGSRSEMVLIAGEDIAGAAQIAD